MTPEQIKQLTPDGYGGDFELTGQSLEKHTNNAGQAPKNIRIAQVDREAAQVRAQVGSVCSNPHKTRHTEPPVERELGESRPTGNQIGGGMNKTTTDLRQLAIKLAHEFNARFLDNYPEIFAIGDEPLGTWAISDQFWNLEDMALAMESELTPDELLDWYWETVERRSVIKKRRKPTINLKSYIMGARYE